MFAILHTKPRFDRPTDQNEDHEAEKPDAILASNALPGFYPAVYHWNFSSNG
jgi:predicted acylesterase/phospholipase RssA